MSKLCMKINGKAVELRWDLRAMMELEEAGHGVGKLFDEMTGETPTKARLLVAAAMINSGAAHKGEKMEMTAEELQKALTPAGLNTLTWLTSLAIRVGMRREQPDDNDDETIDVVLEEMEKKRASEGTRKDS